MTPSEYIAIEKDEAEIVAAARRRIAAAREEADKAAFPTNVRPATPLDVVLHAILWYRTHWKIVSEVLDPNDPWKGYVGDDGCRYGYDRAFVEIGSSSVVSAVIVRGGRILLTQRVAEKKTYPLLWETPGGKVDESESHHAALAREIGEELGTEVTWIRETPLWSGFPIEGDRKLFVVIYPVRIAAFSPTPREGQGIGWFLPEEMRALKLTPGTRAALREILVWWAALEHERLSIVDAEYEEETMP